MSQLMATLVRPVVTPGARASGPHRARKLPPLSFLGVLSHMQDRDDRDPVGGYCEVHRVRKATDECPADLAINGRELQRVVLCPKEQAVQQR